MPEGMTPLKCDICGGPLVMDISGEFAACEHCGTKYMRNYLQQKIFGAVTIQGNVATRPADFTILAGVLQKYSGESTDVVIPDNVTKIADEVFKGTGICSVVIPDSVTHIGKNAFASTQLKELVIPDSVVEIGYEAFSCSELRSVQLSNSLKELAYKVFYGSNLEEIVIPDSVDRIGEDAFAYCSSLSKVVLPKNKILDIYYPSDPIDDKYCRSFYGCWKLDTIENNEAYNIKFFEGTSMWAMRKGRCRHCGNKFNLITKRCTECGHPKDY